MLRLPNGINTSNMINHVEEEHLVQSSYDLAGNTLMHADSDLSMSSRITRVQSVPVIGSHYLPSSESSVSGVRESPTSLSAKDQLRNKKKYIADKLL